MLTLVPATLWGFADRGLVREGFAADLVVFDPETIAPEVLEVAHDLPAGARRLVQKARGHRDIRTTLVYTQVVVDPRLTDAVRKAFAVRPKPRTRAADSRGSTGK